MPHQNLTPEEAAKLEVETLKLKMIAEHGAVIHVEENNPLSTDMELAWYNHIVNYEKMCMDAGDAPVFEVIGKPEVKKAKQLEPSEFKEELHKLLDLMYDKGIMLHFDDEENPETIYRFIVEELFNVMVNKYLGPNGEGHRMFDYYEFHPNYVKEAEKTIHEYVNKLFIKEGWDSEFLQFTYENEVFLNREKHTLEEYSLKMASFKEYWHPSELKSWQNESIELNLEAEEAKAVITLEMENGKCYHLQITFVADFGLCMIKSVESDLFQ